MGYLAERLGLTRTTISLALRGHTSISEKTRARVCALADELDYRPDPIISSIATRRWSADTPIRHRVIAFLCHHTQEERGEGESGPPRRVINPRQTLFLEGAKRRAEELGYKLEPFFVDDYPSSTAVTRVLYSRSIRGLIIPPISNPASKRAMNLDWDKFTAVCCGVGRIRPPLHTITSDVFATTKRVWEAVAQAGFRRIGAALYCHNPVADDDWQRIGASKAAIEHLHLEESAKIPFHTAHMSEEASLMEWYHQHRPEVIIAFNHATAEVLERHKVRMPEDVEIVCLRTLPQSRWSGVAHLHEQIARSAVDLVYTEMRENRWGTPAIPKIMMVQPDWNAGTTFTRPLRWKGLPVAEEQAALEVDQPEAVSAST
jgi:DNA-binding LacI/PurR family transcriptional regulator